MFNSTFNNKPRKQLKRTPFKKRTAPIKRVGRSILARRKTPKPKLDKWISAIPELQSHGSGTLQKRLWRVTSDYVRIRDWYTFDGLCVATGVKIGHWSEGDAGHWKSYSVCNGLYKFHPSNIHLQSKSSNGWGGQEIGHIFGERLKMRYFPRVLEMINDLNKESSLKCTSQEIISMIRDRIKDLGSLPEQPDYYERVVHLLHEETLN